MRGDEVKKALSLLLFLGYCTVSQSIFLKSATAQVTPDNTTNTTVNADGNNFTIEDGDRAGSNLFHSFRDFSVPNGGEAFFDNAVDLSNIFSRVTGGNISNIDGLIRANGSANLFLINPAGIIFGAGARLDLGGSFYGSTADSLLFEDGEFSAVDNLGEPILTINAPIGLSFRDNPAEIVNKSVANGSGLQVSAGEILGLIGGNVNFEGGKITAPGARIELGGLSQAGVINLNPDASLSFSNDVAQADVALTNDAEVNVMGSGGGDIFVNVNNLELSGQSELIAGISETTINPEAQAGDITINAANSVILNGDESTQQLFMFELSETEIVERMTGTGIRNTIGLPKARRNNQDTGSQAIGNGGNILINTNNLQLKNVAELNTSVFGRGNGGDININATEVALSGGLISTQVRGTVFDIEDVQETGVANELGEGSSGAIRISTDSFLLTNRSFIDSGIDIDATGIAGEIVVDAVGEVFIEGESIIRSRLLTEREGNAGNISVSGETIRLNDNSFFANPSFGIGNAGIIKLEATNISFSNSSFLASEIRGTLQAKGGDIILNAAESILLENGSFIFLENLDGIGNAGNIMINAPETSLTGGSFITTSVKDEGIGNAGDVSISSDNLLLDGGSFIFTTTRAEGNAGNIILDLTENLTLDADSFILAENQGGFGDAGSIAINATEVSILGESFIAASIRDEGIGNAGDIEITANNMSLNDESFIIVSTQAEGNAGNITLDLTENLTLDTDSFILAENQGGFGDAGNIAINATEVSILGESFIIASVDEDGIGNAGSIVIDVSSLNLFDRASISVSSEGQGNGGSILINAKDINLETESEINASTSFGTGGNIDLVSSGIITMRNNSSISARAFDEADGGNLNIDARFIVGFPSIGSGSDIVATADQGDGGNININAEQILNLEEGNAIDSQGALTENDSNDLDASSEFGLDGSVNITIFDPSVIQAPTELPRNPIEAEQTVAQACRIDRASEKSSGLTVKGKGGIPPEPTEPIDSDAIIVNGKLTNLDPHVQSQNIQPIETSQGDIYPARGVIVKDSGEVILTAYPTDNIDTRTPHIQANCTHS